MLGGFLAGVGLTAMASQVALGLSANKVITAKSAIEGLVVEQMIEFLKDVRQDVKEHNARIDGRDDKMSQIIELKTFEDLKKL